MDAHVLNVACCDLSRHQVHACQRQAKLNETVRIIRAFRMLLCFQALYKWTHCKLYYNIISFSGYRCQSHHIDMTEC